MLRRMATTASAINANTISGRTCESIQKIPPLDSSPSRCEASSIITIRPDFGLASLIAEGGRSAFIVTAGARAVVVNVVVVVLVVEAIVDFVVVGVGRSEACNLRDRGAEIPWYSQFQSPVRSSASMSTVYSSKRLPLPTRCSNRHSSMTVERVGDTTQPLTSSKTHAGVQST